ncbi:MULTISPECIES: hypothetical protein [unclassified Azospirillum]|uniref:hypothetical protein n=1 Tax=unclassified Azospirillum TaxID=2630922 RepID=UPI000B6F9363|nr:MULTISPECIES: hypothetical protein [unclassified Azospirillum]SNR91283.1 hypothetical protein SAMN05880556_101486 [Azospirillum sp. RU38E]SNS07209.1 hypothetical protein SAMN05880591_101486 [Azospirillum sp. RU37A]
MLHSRVFLLTWGILCICAAAQTAQAVAQPVSTTEVGHNISGSDLSVADWRKRATVDLAAFADALRENYIYAAYPDPERWRAWFGRTLKLVEAELPLVQDEAGYQAVMRHLVASFQDAHVNVRFNASSPIPSNWPGFLARFDNGAYSITASRQAHIADGAQVSACDGKPISWWTGVIAQYEIGLPDTLDEVRNEAALRLFVDRGSPLRPRPAQCVIGGQSVMLNWVPAPMAEINPVIRSWSGSRTPEVSTRLIGKDGAWVRLGYFQPNSMAQAEAFHAAIHAAPSLRAKRFIVLDVRGNGGGPYKWFMAYLRGLYGEAYADHYATARLHIRGVFRLSPAYLKQEEDDGSQASDFKEPPDPPHEINNAVDSRRQAEAVAAGETIFRTTPIPLPHNGTAPANPVRAHVYVLTDYGCGSACISFVDELKRFPGVQQIGLPTSVDSRSGTAVQINLPSGRATAMIATMTRDGRIRDDNEPQLPSIRFTGDIRDDKAVETWFLREVFAGN